VLDLPEGFRPELELRDSGTSAFAATGVDEAIAEALAGEVPLDGGGRLLIQETAACVAIDVDGGGRPALDVNLVAAAEIGRLARLRNLGGTLIVDFVDLTGKAPRQRLDDAVRRAFRGDPLPVQTFPMSPLGIVQISRARRGASPLAAASRVCPACGGSGCVAAS
jgi:ribonuclease E/ribonuclease G